MAQNVVVPPFDVAPETVVGSTPRAEFPFDFPFWQSADIIILVDGVALLPSDFSVQGYFIQNGVPVEGGYGSGKVTLNTPVANCTVTVDRFVNDERLSQFSRAAPLGMPALNADLNKLTARDQDLKRRSRDATRIGNSALALAEELSAASILPRVTVATVAALTALKPGVPPFVRVAARDVLGDNGAGDFEWIEGDQSANVSRDPGQGVWVAPLADSTGASGAWRRAYNGPAMLDWFSGVDPTGSVPSHDGLQRAFNAGFPTLQGSPGAVYAVSADTLTLPSNITLEKVRLRRVGFNSGWLLRNSAAGPGPQNNENVTLRHCHFEDSGVLSGRGNMLKLDGVKNLTIEDSSVYMSSPNDPVAGAWSAFIAGEDIRISGWRVNSLGAGLWSDGMHLGQVRRFSMTDFHIQCGDDGIALHFPPGSYGYLDGPSRDIVIGNGYVSAAEANGLRIGAYGATEAPDPASRWENVLFHDITFGPCKACISIYDNRAPSEIAAQNTGITFDGMNFGDQTNTRLIWIAGNPNTELSANYAQHNFRDITLRNIRGRQAQGTLITGGGVDRLVLENVDLKRSPVATSISLPDVWIRQCDELVMRDCTFDTSETGSAIYCNYVKDITSFDGTYLNANNAFGLFVIGRPAEHGVKARFQGGLISGGTRLFYSTGAGVVDEFIVDGMQMGTFTLTDTSIVSATKYVFRPVGALGWGNGSPEGVITATRGTLWGRRDGGPGTTLYVKETSSGNAGWVAMRSVTAPLSGTSANRPAGATVGQEYYDTSLGKPVWFKSVGVWVDATGATV